MIEKPYFSLQSTTVSDEFSTLSDDAMTGDEYGKVIGMIGSADRSYCFRTAYHRSFFEIASSLSVGDLFECFPCLHLELSSMWSEWYSEIFSLSLEVFWEFFAQFFYKSIFSCLYLLPESVFEYRESLRKFTMISELEEMEWFLICDGDEVTERRGDESLKNHRESIVLILFSSKVFLNKSWPNLLCYVVVFSALF